MAEPLTAGITRDRAFELLNEHNKDPFHITHGETVEGTMRYFAREFDPENEEFWGIVGLLHDLDWEEHEDDPVNHTIYAAEILEGRAPLPSLSVPSRRTRPISTLRCPSPSCRWKRSCLPAMSSPA